MRRQEPSMEDILASIRRIIADDQSQGQRAGYGAEEAPPGGAVAPPPDTEKPAEPDLDSERSRLRPSGDLDGVLDLATLPEAALTESPSAAGYDDHEVAETDSAHAEPEHQPGHEDGEDPVGHDFLRTSEAAFAEAPAPYRARQDPASLFRMPRHEPELMQSDALQRDYRALEMPAFRSDKPEEFPLQDDTAAEPGDALISPALGASVMSAFETLAATVVLQNDDMLERVMRELLRPLVKNWLDENLPTLVERLVRNEIERVARGGRG